ncbi:MAG: DUF6502 family protein [Paracoccaceae bacterium]
MTGGTSATAANIETEMSDPTPNPFAAVLARLLGPLAQAMVVRGISVQEATAALKHALFDAAVETEGAEASDSRISLRTGLHRKDVKRLRTQQGDPVPTRSTNAVAMAVSFWATAPEYQRPDGGPRDLPREGSEDGPGLYDLIRRTRVDMAPGTVLAAMLDQGVTEQTPDGTYRLRTSALLPDAGSTALIAAYQATLSAHLQAATHNLVAPPGTPRHFDRVVRYSHLSQRSVEALSAEATKKAQALLEEINAMARALQEQDADTDGHGHFAFGAYQMFQPDTDTKE